MRKLILVCVICLGFSVGSAQQNYKLLRVIDGMALILISNNSDTIQVSLLGLRTPLLKQSFGHSAKHYVANALYNKKIFISHELEIVDTKYVEIAVDSNQIFNIQMLTDGWAWYDNRMLKNPRYKQAEDKARNAKVGLWYYEVSKPWSVPSSGK